MSINPQIFRDYDIRGMYPRDLDELSAYKIGRAFGTHVIRSGGKNIVVGRDNRASSPSLAANLVRGLVDCGILVTDVGVTLTPIIHFLTYTRNFNAGINVTASHNPKEFNGFRLDLAQAEPFYGESIKDLFKSIQSDNFESGYGSVISEDLSLYYIEYFRRSFNINSRFKVVVNCGNGAAGSVVPRIFSAIGCDCIILNSDFDNSFPKGVPDPENPDYMKELSEEVVKHGAQLGVAFDTDGDRVGVVDEKGTVYESDKLTLLFAVEALSRYPGGKVLFDVKCSGIMESEITKLGGVAVRTKTGHSSFVTGMKDGAILGGEYSGHIYFGGDYFGYDDGLYAACRLISLFEKAQTPLSKLMSAFPKTYHTGEIKVECADGQKSNVIEHIKRAKLGNAFSISTLDGDKISKNDLTWVLIRASNTSPYISIRIESETQKEIDEMKGLLSELLLKVGLSDQEVRYAPVKYS